MNRLQRLFKWMYPGMGVKRWLFLSWMGLALFTVGIVLYVKFRWAYWLEAHVVRPFNDYTGNLVPFWAFHLLFMVVGLVLIVRGLQQWFATIYGALAPYGSPRLVDVMFERMALANSTSLVAVGGGTGLSSLLRGLKHYTSNITAVVAVSDDGGSSGRLRKDRGLLPPGDIRNCLVALADDDTTLSNLFQHRFAEGGELAGHSFGNLFLAAMTDVAGDFDKAIELSSKILAIRGKVLPGTLRQTSISAEFIDGTIVEGESEIPKARKKIRRVWLSPSDCEAMPKVLTAIREADAIILGPGSLYTSVLPNLLVRGMVDALAEARGLRIYVCNVMTQPGETDGYTAADHLKAVFKHAGRRVVDVALVNSEVPTKLVDRYEAEGAFPVEPDIDEIRRMGVRPIAASLINETNLVRHDPDRLAEAIQRIMIEHLEQTAAGSGTARRKIGWLSRYARRREKATASGETQAVNAPTLGGKP